MAPPLIPLIAIGLGVFAIAHFGTKILTGSKSEKKQLAQQDAGEPEPKAKQTKKRKPGYRIVNTDKPDAAGDENTGDADSGETGTDDAGDSGTGDAGDEGNEGNEGDGSGN